MKKLSILLVFVLVLCTLVPVMSYAEEKTYVEHVEEMEAKGITRTTEIKMLTETEELTEAEELTEEPTESHTYGDRVVEWGKKHFDEILSALSTLILAVIIPWLKRKFKKVENVTEMNSVTNSQSIDAMNKLIEAYNSFKVEVGGLKELFDEALSTSTEAKSACVGVLEILQTIYANSKNLPQGIKDIVNYKYARAIGLPESTEVKTDDESNKV